MGCWSREPSVEFVDTGKAPEYFIEDVARQDLIEGNCIRSYVCARRGNLLVLQYTNVIPLVRLAVMARQTLLACADYHNDITMLDGHRLLN